MRDQFLEHWYVAKSYGLLHEYLDFYRFFRMQGVSRAFSAYYASKEIGID